MMFGILNRTVLMPGSQLSRYCRVGLYLRHCLPSSSTSLIKSLPARELSDYGKPLNRKASQLQTKDGIPLTYQLIYNSFQYHAISQYFCQAMPPLYIFIGSIAMYRNFDELFPDLFQTALNIWISILFLYINIGTAIIAYKSPVRIYHNKETGDYKAIFHNLKPFDIRVLEFKKGMVGQIPPPDILTLFRHDRYKIKGQDLYMFESFFRYPGDLYGMFDEIQKEGEEEEEQS